MDLLTIGYQGRTRAQVTGLLQDAGVDLVLDVRQLAWSRKPGFSGGQLRAALERAGIAYHHDPRLGSPADLRRAYRASGDWDGFARAYGAHLATLRGVVARHVSTLDGGRVCLLCFERQAGLCHRSLVAEAFVREGARLDAHL